MSDPVPVSAISTAGTATVSAIGSNGSGGGKIMSAAELRAAAESYSAAQVDTLLGGYLPLTGGTLTGPITGTGGLIEQRNGLTAQCLDIFETYTSGTNNGKLRIKATSSGHQIGSARGTSGSNRTVDLGHFDASDVFSAALQVRTDLDVRIGASLRCGTLRDANGVRHMSLGGGFVQTDVEVYQINPIYHAAKSTVTVPNGYGSIWVASTSGTKDGVAFAVGDVLITTVTSSVSKTVLLVDYSAI